MINKFTDFLNEYVSNLSKNRKWPTKTNGKWDYSDMYFTYHLPKSELGKYLNTWFVGVVSKSKDEKQTYRDEMITLKKVDKETASHLYNKEYNPVTINIFCPSGAKFEQNEKGEDLYEMKTQIHSIDDSSYSIWWQGYYGSSKTFQELLDIRTELMKWINTQSELNGDIFLEICMEMGASEDSKNYD